MAQKFDSVGVILAGGGSQRFGQAKAYAKLGGETLLARATRRLSQQIDGPVAVNVDADNSLEIEHNYLVRDQLERTIGPLAGLHAGLDWARSVDAAAVITLPVDTPFFSNDYAAHLTANGSPSVARSAGRTHPLCGYWSTDLLGEIVTAIENDVRAVFAWCEQIEAKRVEFPLEAGLDPFLNVNTPADLRLAERLLPSWQRAG